MSDEANKYPQYFKSCYIIEVIVDKNYITLIDTTQTRYYINTNNKNILSQFKSWFNEIFLKGISQTLTIFQYELADVSECETKMLIVKFLRKTQQLI